MQIIRKVLSVVRYKLNILAKDERAKLAPGQPISEDKQAELINQIDPE